MKKQEFLSELTGYLQVLQDEEQNDIIDEYSQHIQMKMEKGLSEEEAIRDFGPIHELAAEILEAYHVKPDFEKGENRRFSKGFHFSHLPISVKEKRQKAGILLEWMKQAGKHVAKAGRRFWGIAKACVGTCLRFLTCPIRLGKQAEGKWMEGRRKQSLTEGNEEKYGANVFGQRISSAGKKGIGLVQMLIAWIIGCLFWWCRLGWNFCVMLAATGSAVCGLVFLYLFGLLIVLWTQGYPIFGAVLGCLGAVLCFVSLSTLGCTFFWIKPKGSKSHTVEEKERALELADRPERNEKTDD